MTYQRFIAEHDTIEAAAQIVLTVAGSAVPRVAEAARALEVLTQLLRDHLTAEDPVIYQTILCARDGRHAEAARLMGVELDRLKEDWASYLYRWDAAHIAADWSRFRTDSIAMLGRVRERVTVETMILYSLAVHFEVIGVA